MTEFETEVMQGTGDLHDQIRETLLGVAKNVFDNAATLDTGHGMFNVDAGAGEEAVQPFVDRRQLLAARLFFGWYVSTPDGS